MGVESRYGLKFGYMDHGPRNLITDVPGVRVGHVTLHGWRISGSHLHWRYSSLPC